MAKKRNFLKGKCSGSESKRQRTVETDGIASTSSGSNLESVVRKVVKEEFESFKQFFLSYLQSSPRLSLNRIGTSKMRRWKLDFLNSLPDTLFTGNKIKADANAPLRIAIFDVSSNEIVTSGPLSNIKVETLVLDGDFCDDDVNSWSKEEFDASPLSAREGKGPLVIGERIVTLRNGVGHLEKIKFTDISRWTKSGKFKLGARAVRNASNSESVREAISTAVKVKDKHGEAYQKHDPPNYDDELWRLEKIKKDGKYHTQLASQGIKTVQDLLRLSVRDPSFLRMKFGSQISKNTWDTIIDHANKCIIDPKQYVYRHVAPPVVLMFDSIFKVVGAIFEGQNYVPRDNLSESEKSWVEALKNHAYQNPENIKEYNQDVPPTVLPLGDASFPKTGVVEMQQYAVQITNQEQQVHVSPNSTDLIPHVLGDRYQLKDVTVTPGFHLTQHNCPFQSNSSNVASSSCMTDRSFEQSVGAPSTAMTDEHSMDDIFSQILNWPPVSAMLGEQTDLLPIPCSETGLDLHSSPGIVDCTNRRHMKWATLVTVVRVALFFTSERGS